MSSCQYERRASLVRETHTKAATVRIRDANEDEAAVLEALQRRSSDVWEQYREQLAAHPDVIELPQAFIDNGWVRVAAAGDDTPIGFSVVIPDRRRGGQARRAVRRTRADAARSRTRAGRGCRYPLGGPRREGSRSDRRSRPRLLRADRLPSDRRCADSLRPRRTYAPRDRRLSPCRRRFAGAAGPPPAIAVVSMTSVASTGSRSPFKGS